MVKQPDHMITTNSHAVGLQSCNLDERQHDNLVAI